VGRLATLRHHQAEAAKLDTTIAAPRNLKYMRAFAAAWPERAIVQEPLARIPWYHHIALLEKLEDSADRLWYARQVIEQGWSHSILVLPRSPRRWAGNGRQPRRPALFRLQPPGERSTLAGS